MRIFVDNEQIKSNKITITGDDLNHIKNVMRMKVGDILTVCDGKKTDYTCTIDEINNKSVILHAIYKTKNTNEPNINLSLYAGLPKSSKKMELIIQKTVELGVDEITFVQTNYSVKKLRDYADRESRLERFTKISKAAAMQSKRGIIPTVWVAHFDDVIEAICTTEVLCIALYEAEDENNLKNVLQSNKHFEKIVLFTGPEGGFSKEEIQEAKKLGIITASLGSRILKAETAAIVGTAIIMYEFDQMEN